MLGEQRLPDREVAILDLRQPQIDVAAVLVRLGRSQPPIEKRGVSLVLPMLAEGLEIRGRMRRGQRPAPWIRDM